MTDITFLGNAPVDMLSHVDDSLLAEFGLRKGDWNPMPREVVTAIKQRLGKVTELPGGSAANTAYALARLGAKVGLIAPYGDDTAGTLFRNDLVKAGIAHRPARPNSSSLVIYCLISPDGERTFVSDGGLTPLTEADIHEDDIKGSQWLYVETYLFGDQFPAVLKACRLARKNGVKIAITLAARNFVENHFDKIALLLREGMDLYICNDEELEALRIAELKGDDAKHAEETMAAIRTTPHVVTYGKNGATLFTGSQNIQAPTTAVAKVVDSTGAGDAFAAGFLYGYIYGRNPQASLNLGHKLAAATIQQVGARLPDGFDLLRREIFGDAA